MLRPGNRRRRAKPQFRWPSVNWWPLVSLLGAMLVCTALYASGRWVLDRPVAEIVIHAPFERVSADRIEAKLRPELGRGFLALDLPDIQQRIRQQAWVAGVRVTRRWPGTLQVVIVEQQPAARWGEHGLLNTRGELFIEQAARVPAELPRLQGPVGSEQQVARRFMAMQQEFTRRGTTLIELQLDERGAWSFRLGNGIEVRLGSVAVEERLALFYRAFDEVLGAVSEEVDYVDMRYANGFAVGWKNPDRMNAASRPGAHSHV